MKINIIPAKLIKRIRWRRLLLAAFSISFVLAAWGTAKSMDKPGFCGLCHAMKPYYNSWEKSGHSKIPCFSCHSDYIPPEKLPPNVKRSRKFLITTNKVVIVFGKSLDTILEKRVVLADYLDKNLSTLKIYYDMAAGKMEDPWKSCLKCHNDLIYSADKDYFGHYQHLQTELSKCSQCHAQPAHSKPTKSSWSACRQCHQDKLPLPGSHKAETFESTHGRDYNAGANCTICHPQGTKQALCLNCHKTEIPHQGDYKTKHISLIAQVGIRNCMNCHKKKTDGPPQLSTACEACHGWEMPHARTIIKTHTSLVKAQGINTCSNCHRTSPEQKDMATACIDCHQVSMPHPPNIKRVHPSIVKTYGKDVCNFCHSPANPVSPGAPWTRPDFCLNCHTQKENKPHPPGFRTQHQLQYIQPDGCFMCHTGPGPQHCFDCHPGE